MGDIGTEPSMEEILSSIKRVIAEGDSPAAAPRARRTPAPRGASTPRADYDEILELSDPVLDDHHAAHRAHIAQEDSMPKGSPNTSEGFADRIEPIVSDHAVEAMRGPLETLSRLVVKPEVQGSDTLEGMVREMLKPMLRDWLDANLPQLVESMVAKEIARITGRK